MPGRRENPPRSAQLPPGYEEGDPYEDEKLSTYPDWWRENVETFREFGLRPYKPSRFSDEVPVQRVINELEAEFETTVRLRAINPQSKEARQIWVAGEPVQDVEYVREPAGFTRYFIESSKFRRIVTSTVEEK